MEISLKDTPFWEELKVPRSKKRILREEKDEWKEAYGLDEKGGSRLWMEFSKLKYSRENP
jgi:hypothetical protein